MLYVLPYHSDDQHLAAKLAHWIADLGSVEKHQCLVICDKMSDPDLMSEIKLTLAGAFRHVVSAQLRESAPGVQGMNLLFRRAARQIQASSAGAFLWGNPDAIPTRKGWMDAIEAAWGMLPRGKYFLGPHIGGPFPHMAAVGVYHQDCEVHASNLVLANINPFNINAAPQVVPKMAATSLIMDAEQDVYDSKFAVMQHGFPDGKDGSLIDAMRAGDPSHLAPLTLAAATPASSSRDFASTKENGSFSVPEAPMTNDQAAQRAASRAGSEGIPSDEIETSVHVPKMAPPQVDPLVHAARERLAEVYREPVTPPSKISDRQFRLEVSAENIDMVTKAIAGFRDKDAASKAMALAALRESGFHISGKQAQGGRK